KHDVDQTLPDPGQEAPTAHGHGRERLVQAVLQGDLPGCIATLRLAEGVGRTARIVDRTGLHACLRREERAGPRGLVAGRRTPAVAAKALAGLRALRLGAQA